MFNEKKLNDIFYQMVSNIPSEDVISINEKYKLEAIKKYLCVIDSLNHSILNINSFILNHINDTDFCLEEKLEQDMDNLYLISENFKTNIAQFLTGNILEMYNDVVPEETEANLDEQ